MKNTDKRNLSNNIIKLNELYEVWRWDIDKVTNSRESYKIQQGNHNVKVAIIDSGVDRNHPDLKDNLIISKSFVPGNKSLDDNLGHGTMVAGEIASNGNVKGVAPKIAIASYKVFDDATNCNSAWVIRAIIEAAKDNMNVINLSLGSYKFLMNKNDLVTINAYKKAISYATSKNCVVIAASGTSPKGINISNPFSLNQKSEDRSNLGIYLPGGLRDVITVSATNKNDELAYYSNYGSNIEISAPAGDYGPMWRSKQLANMRYMSLVTVPTNFQQSELSISKGFKKGYEFIGGGTSIAAPKVSAAVALIIIEYEKKYGFKPSLSEIKKLIYSGATPGAKGNNQLYYGNGILNIYNSLSLLSI